MAKPFVSVVMSVYNTHEEYLISAVDSILNQTYPFFELIIIDDCSDIYLYKNTIFTDKRIRIFRNSQNKGCGYCFKKGVELSVGKYIARMDSDDISLPTRLEKQVAFMESNLDVVACGTWFEFFGGKNHAIKHIIDDNEYYRCSLLFGNRPALLHPSVMIRKQTLDDNGINYHEFFRLAEDYKLWVELSRFGIITNIKEVLLKYRIHAGQLTNGNEKSVKTREFDNKVRIGQINSIGVSLNEKEQKVFLSDINNKRIRPKKYFYVLKKISDANKRSQFFNQEKLDKRIKEQWKDKIIRTNNPFVLFWTAITIKHEFSFIFSTKARQLINKITKKEMGIINEK